MTTTTDNHIQIDALALLDEYRERAAGARDDSSTQQQAFGVMHFLTDLLVDAGGDRSAISGEYGFGRLVREDQERRS
jgi:hypothetical protein